MRRRPMPPAGRPRSSKIPAHIDAAKLPKGLYFNPLGRGRWWRREGKAKVYVAGADAKLSDLHAIMESSGPRPHTCAALVKAFEDSDHYRGLKPASQRDYTYCGKTLCGFKLRDGTDFGRTDVRAWSRPVLQKVIEALAKGKDGKPTPSKAAHVGRYLPVLIGWGELRGHCVRSLAGGFDLPTEKKDPRVPERDEMRTLIEFARERARPGTKGSVATYLWAVGEIAYRCRLRGVEVLDLSDANALANGLHCVRRKGSDPNVTQWEGVREAWDYLIACRDAIWNRRKRPVPLRAEDRPLVVARDGEALSRRSLTLSWGRLVTLAIEEGIVARRFGLHGLKHRGVTDTPGTRGEKRQASGHRTEAMVAHYDHEMPEVPAAGLGKIPMETRRKP